MAKNTDIDPGSVQWHFNPAYHNPYSTTQSAPIWPTSMQDPLSEAVEEAGGAVEGQAAAALAAAQSAEAAEDKLAQEAFVADPASMRKQFPKLMQDMKEEFPNEIFFGSLNLREIDMGLRDMKLSQNDRNLLAVFQSGFDVLKSEILPEHYKDANEHNYGTINDSSLAIVDKAVNRNINEDPLFWHLMFWAPLVVGVASGYSAGMMYYMRTHDEKTALLATGAGALVGLAAGVATPVLMKVSGSETETYDQIQANYLTFSNAYQKPVTAPDATQ